MLIEDKTVSGTGSFVALSFAYYYYASRLGFISILTFYFSPRLREYLVPGDCYFFFCSFAMYMLVIEMPRNYFKRGPLLVNLQSKSSIIFQKPL